MILSGLEIKNRIGREINILRLRYVRYIITLLRVIIKNTVAESIRTTPVFSRACSIRILRGVIDLKRYKCIIWDWSI